MHNILHRNGEVAHRGREGEDRIEMQRRVIRNTNRLFRLDLTGRTFNAEFFRHRTFEECDFGSSVFEDVVLQHNMFRDCDFSAATFLNVVIQSCHFRSSIFTGARMHNLQWIRSTADDAIWTGALIESPGLILCDKPEHGPNLGGATIRHSGIQVVLDRGFVKTTHRSDGHIAHLIHVVSDTDPWMIHMGCRLFTFPEAWTHWKNSRGGTSLGDETFAILRYFWEVAQCP